MTTNLQGGINLNGSINLQPTGNTVPNPVAHYKMNDDAANTTVTDAMGSYDGTANVNTSTFSTTGKINNALYFNLGRNVNCSNIFEPNDSSFSASFWFKTGVNKAGFYLFYGSLTDEWWGVQLSGVDGSIVFSVDDDSTKTQFNSTSNGYDDNAWHHCVVVRDTVNNDLYIYVDTESANTTDNTGDITNSSYNDYYIGTGRNDSGLTQEAEESSIDDVRIYNFKLTLDEVGAIYNSGNGTEEQNPSY